MPTVTQQLAALKAAADSTDAHIEAAMALLLGTPTPDAQPLPADLAGIRSLLRVMLGQPQVPTGAWRMSNYTSASRLDALEPVVSAQQNLILALTQQLNAQGQQLGTENAALLALTAQLQLTTADAKASLANDAANAAAAALADAKAVAAKSKADAADAKAEAAKAKADAAFAKGEAAALAAAAAQSSADADKLLAQQAQTTADGAQATAAQAKADAATANAQATADKTLAQQAQASADAAQANANTANAALAVLNGRIKMKRVTTPVIGINGTGTMNVLWDTPYADDNYNVIAEAEGAALLGLAPDVTARAKDGCTVQLKNSLGLALTAAAGSISLTAIHA